MPTQISRELCRCILSRPVKETIDAEDPDAREEKGMSEQESKKRSRKRTPNNRTTTGFRISDELWEVVQLLLPVHVNTHRFGGGRPRVPGRRIIWRFSILLVA